VQDLESPLITQEAQGSQDVGESEMGSMNHVELLQRRSRAFYDYASTALERGDYDVVAFMCEQAARLRLKALLLRMLGFMPRSHRVGELLGMLSKSLEDISKAELSREVARFTEDDKDDLRLLEEAYTRSRYLATTYEREDALRSLRVVEKLFKLVEDVEDDVFPPR
jgi:HEPN domain-containing protein